MESFDLECDIRETDFEWVGKVKQCTAKNVDITTSNEEITSINGHTEPTNIQILWISGQTVAYLPKGIDKFFPNLKGLVVASSNLKSLKQDDLKLLHQLGVVGFNGNDLESLEGDLFEFNPKLKLVNFASNKLRYVGENLLNNLKDLQVASFESNDCIKVNAPASSEIAALIEILKSECKFPREWMLIKAELIQLKEENIDLKVKNIQKESQTNLKISEIFALKSEKSSQAALIAANEVIRRENENLIRSLNAKIDEKNSEMYALEREKISQDISITTLEMKQLQNENSISQCCQYWKKF